MAGSIFGGKNVPEGAKRRERADDAKYEANSEPHQK